MESYTNFEGLIHAFCEKHKVGLIQPDEYLQYSIYVDDFELKCRTVTRLLLIEVDLGKLPESRLQRHSLCCQLMQHSLLEAADSRPILSMSRDDKICLYQRHPLGSCGLDDFEKIVSEIANQADMYKEIFSDS